MYVFKVGDEYIEYDLGSVQVPSQDLSTRALSGVLQTFKNGRRKTVCWFTRNIVHEDLINGVTVRPIFVIL